MNDDFGTPIPPIEEAEKKDNKIWIILIVVVLVLCCCCIAVSALFYFVLGDLIIEAVEDLSWVPMLLLS